MLRRVTFILANLIGDVDGGITSLPFGLSFKRRNKQIVHNFSCLPKLLAAARPKELRTLYIPPLKSDQLRQKSLHEGQTESPRIGISTHLL